MNRRNKDTPALALVPVNDEDRETWSLGQNPEFLAVLQRSWDRLHAEGPVPLAEAWRRLVADE